MRNSTGTTQTKKSTSITEVLKSYANDYCKVPDIEIRLYTVRIHSANVLHVFVVEEFPAK